MREDWEVKKLGDVCNYLTDGDWIENKDQSLSGIRLIQTGNIGKGYFKDKSDSYKFISESTFYDLDCKEVFPGDILVSRLPDPIGRACIVPQLNGKLITAVDCTIIRTKELLLSQFFIYYTMSNVYYSRIKNFITGAVRKRISRSNLSRIEIPIPPLQTQHQIVEELDCLTSIIEKQKKQLEELDNLAQAIFYDMFGDPIENEKGWNVNNLDNLCIKITDGEHLRPPVVKEGIPFLSAKDITNGFVDFSETLYVSEEFAKKSRERCNPEYGDLLIISRGATIGKTCIIDSHKVFCLLGSVILLKCYKSVVALYLLYCLKHPHIQNLLKSLCGALAQPAIYLKDIKKLYIPVPPFSLQQQFASKIEAIEKQKELIKKSIKETEDLFNSRMDYYFN